MYRSSSSSLPLLLPLLLFLIPDLSGAKIYIETENALG